MLKSKIWVGILAACCFALCGCKTVPPKTVADKSPRVVSVKRIWDAGRHNAFTDLIRFHGQWYCTFRESEGHIQGNGKIRVIVSGDGGQWKSAALLEEAGVDLRDPKLSIMPGHRLMLVFGGTVHEGTKIIERQPRVAFSRDGFNWTAPERTLGKGDWLWRVTWNRGRALYLSFCPAWQIRRNRPSWSHLPGCNRADDGAHENFRAWHTL